jgi:hypothetical protein
VPEGFPKRGWAFNSKAKVRATWILQGCFLKQGIELDTLEWGGGYHMPHEGNSYFKGFRDDHHQLVGCMPRRHVIDSANYARR